MVIQTDYARAAARAMMSTERLEDHASSTYNRTLKRLISKAQRPKIKEMSSNQKEKLTLFALAICA